MQGSCTVLPGVTLKQCLAWTIRCVQSSTLTLRACGLGKEPLWDVKQRNGISREDLWINQPPVSREALWINQPPLNSSVLLQLGCCQVLAWPCSSAEHCRAPVLAQMACAPLLPSLNFPAPSVTSLTDMRTSGQRLTRFSHLSVLMF